ncbi:MAG: acyl-CoA synthetase, partial [Microbacterium pygmaeum]
MTPTPAARTFEVRHVQLARAAFAALAAVMITFSSDHSAEVGLSVFSGFAIATGLIFLVSAWLVYPSGRRWPALALGVISVVAGMAGGLAPLRTVAGFFVIVGAWALVSGVLEAVVGW